MTTPSAVPDDQKCPQCGAALPAGALAGLCPACLLKQAAAGDTMPPVAFVPPSLAELARLFPQLEILALIGTGGMGAVYKARQKELDRIVALKILPPGAGDSPAFAERFTREAKALARLNHPGIVTIHDTGRIDGLYYFLMEFVDGVNLRQLLKTGRLAPREALAIVPQICDALQYAHDAGIVHRDIKPENILLDRQGRVKVADFGLAKLVGAGGVAAAVSAAEAREHPALHRSAATDATKAGQVMGTPQYMAPEQREHPLDVDHRADIYSLGVVFYQMLTGELPGKQLEPPSSRMRGIIIDVRLDEVVLRALEKQPGRRYQQASEVKTIVETIATTPPPSHGLAAPAQSKWQRMHVGTRVLVLAALVGSVWTLMLWKIIPWADKLKARGEFPVFGVALHVLLAIAFAVQLVAEIRKPQKIRRRWAIAVFGLNICLWLIFAIVNVGNWSKTSRLVGVWVPAKLDDSAGERFAALPLWITSVTQQQQVVVMDIVCKFDSPPPQLGLQFSGSLVSYPAALTTQVAGVDHFIEPEGYLKLTGPPCSKGKMTYRLGFILPDDAAAAMVAEQVRRYHIGKPRGLSLERFSFTLFQLDRIAGRNTEGQPVRENLFAELSWPSPNFDAVYKGVPVGRLAFVTSAAATSPGEISVTATERTSNVPKRIQGDEPSFLPDGKHFLYSHQEPIDWKAGVPDGGRNGIYLYDLTKEVGNPLLSDPTGSCEQPSCSADGTRIAYVFTPKDRKASHIWTANADGTGRKQLTSGDHFDWTPRWSPDGRKILFETTRGGKREAYIMDADGQNQISLTPNALIAHSPSWSPDGQRIAFMSHGTNSPANIFVMNADGSNVQNISKGTTRDSEPVWSPDGKWIAFTRTATNPPCPDRMDVWIMRSDGSGQQQITHNEPGIWSNGLTWGGIVQTKSQVAGLKGEATNTPAAAQNLYFGPVIERVLPVGDNSGPSQWLILDSGDILEHHTSSPSLGVYQRGEILSILTVGHAFHQADYDGNSTPLDIARVVDNPQNLEHATGGGMESRYWTNHFPRAIIFGTPAGKAGLLQILDFTDNPRSVKIRYKLVQGLVANAPAVVSHSKNGSVQVVVFALIVGLPGALGIAWLIHSRRMRRYQQASAVKTMVATPPSTGGPATSKSVAGLTEPARFSRMAAIGAACAAFFLVVLFRYFHGRWMPGFLLHSSVRWGGLLATTVIGWIAVSQIRHSAGKLRGLKLAVFSGLLFPLLSLDGLLVFICYSVSVTMAGISSTRDHPQPLVISAIGLSLIVDWLIVHWTWRALRKRIPLGTTAVSETGRSTSRFSRPVIGWAVVALIAVCGLGVYFLISRNTVAGRVLLPDGTPVTDAIVNVATPQRPVSLGIDGIRHVPNVVGVKSIPGGEFWIRFPGERFAIAVWHEKGFATASGDELKKSPTIVLQPWGHVAGTVRIGGKLLAHEPVVLVGHVQLGAYPRCSIYYETSTETDARGEFAFDRAPSFPIQDYSSVEVGRFVKNTVDHSTTVEVRPGQTVQVPIGGTGRPVIGQIALPPGDTHKLGSLTIDGVIYTYPYSSTPAKFAVPVQKDGTFRVEDVPAGAYELNIQVREPSLNAHGGGLERIGLILNRFIIPAMEGGHAIEPFDLGTLTVNSPASGGGR